VRARETIYALPVTNDHRRLVGMLGLRDLVLAPPHALIGDLMDTEVLLGASRHGPGRRSLASCARLTCSRSRSSTPRTGSWASCTVDDAMEVLEEEETEGPRPRAAAPNPWPAVHDFVGHADRSLRVIWLLALIVAATADRQRAERLPDDRSTRLVALALFIPLRDRHGRQLRDRRPPPP
jgi:magnesium transporter